MIQRYMEAKYGPAKDYPHRAVTEAELIRALVSSGTNEEDAKRQAFVCKSLGSEVLVGKEWLSVKPKARRR